MGIKARTIVGSALVLIFLFFMIESWRAPQLRVCTVGRGPLRFDAQIASLEKKIIRSGEIGKVTDLIFWASCDFNFSLAGSEHQITRLPHEVMPELMGLFKDEVWELRVPEPTDPSTEKVVAANEKKLASKSGRVSFVFKKSENTGWFWAGVETSDTKIFESWLSIPRK